PYARSSPMATLAALATEPPPEPTNAGPLTAVIDGLLRRDPTERISAEVAQHLLSRVAGLDPGPHALPLKEPSKAPAAPTSDLPHGPVRSSTPVATATGPANAPRPAAVGASLPAIKNDKQRRFFKPLRRLLFGALAALVLVALAVTVTKFHGRPVQ